MKTKRVEICKVYVTISYKNRIRLIKILSHCLDLCFLTVLCQNISHVSNINSVIWKIFLLLFAFNRFI